MAGTSRSAVPAIWCPKSLWIPPPPHLREQCPGQSSRNCPSCRARGAPLFRRVAQERLKSTPPPSKHPPRPARDSPSGALSLSRGREQCHVWDLFEGHPPLAGTTPVSEQQHVLCASHVGTCVFFSQGGWGTGGGAGMQQKGRGLRGGPSSRWTGGCRR